MRSLSGSIESVTPEAFKKFLREVQKVGRAPGHLPAGYADSWTVIEYSSR